MLYIYKSYNFILYILCFTVIKIATVKKKIPLDSICIFLCMVFILTYLRMALVQAETCSITIRATN